MAVLRGRPWEVDALENLHATRSGGSYSHTRAIEGGQAGEWHSFCPICGGGLTVAVGPDGTATLACRNDERPCDPEAVRAQVIRGYVEAPTHTDVTSIRSGRAAIDGATFVLDAPAEVPRVWGDLWASGESFFIVGPQGVGKTTLAQQVALARVGIGPEEVLGMKVEPSPKRVLYLALDRPRQVARSFRRMVAETDREALRDWLVIWPGPLPFDVAAEPERLADFAAGFDADTVVIDSLKDAALELSRDEVGSRVNLAQQHLLAAGIELIVIHHQRKGGPENKKPRSLPDVYGSTWLTAGAGSVVLLWGEPGDPIVELTHLKQPAGEVGPLKVIHDHDAGRSHLHESVDLAEAIDQSRDGLTAMDAARHLFGASDPTDNQREKARRRLDGLVSNGRAKKVGGERGMSASYLTVTR